MALAGGNGVVVKQEKLTADKATRSIEKAPRFDALVLKRKAHICGTRAVS